MYSQSSSTSRLYLDLSPQTYQGMYELDICMPVSPSTFMSMSKRCCILVPVHVRMFYTYVGLCRRVRTDIYLFVNCFNDDDGGGDGDVEDHDGDDADGDADDDAGDGYGDDNDDPWQFGVCGVCDVDHHYLDYAHYTYSCYVVFVLWLVLAFIHSWVQSFMNVSAPPKPDQAATSPTPTSPQPSQKPRHSLSLRTYMLIYSLC